MAWKNVDQPMLTPDGQNIKDGKQPPPLTGQVDQRDNFTFRTALKDALPVMYPYENPPPGGFEKKKRFKLLQRLTFEKDPEMDLSDAEMATIRAVADMAYGTMVYGIIEEWLETAYVPAHSEASNAVEMLPKPNNAGLDNLSSRITV